MKKIIFLSLLAMGALSAQAQKKATQRTQSFDAGWRFIKDSIIEADAPGYDDSRWRMLDLPHDWSIEDLPNQQDGKTMGPFSKDAINKMRTGYTVGGTAWYRKKFTINATDQNKVTWIQFEGVYMNPDIWLNGHFLGNHPYGYTSFYYHLTPYLNPAGKTNVIAVRVKNEGKNSRWYSGSGIYRHVWLTTVDPLHVDVWGTYITTPKVSEKSADVQVVTTIKNDGKQNVNLTLQTELMNAAGKVVGTNKTNISAEAGSSTDGRQMIAVTNPSLWSVEKPTLYKAKITLLVNNKQADAVITSFGIRSIHFHAATGFTLNGKSMKLKGGCIHHDNGPLGAAVIDRAEERKIELLKSAGYNAIRLSHNPPSPQLLDACDRLGMLVIDEAYDMWEKEKTPDDYHLYFKNWGIKDLQSMIFRDRNHPSIIMWSIGNEIPELADSSGYVIAKKLADEAHRLDPTRAVTEALVLIERLQPGKTWDMTAPNFASLDAGGYNYVVAGSKFPLPKNDHRLNRYEEDHVKYPERIMYSSEFYPPASLENWNKAEKYPYVIGNFSWTAMDYIGEAGVAAPRLVPEAVKADGMGGIMMMFFSPESWPIFNAYCGDLDLIGNPKAASYYQQVVWRNSKIELLVHRPIPAAMVEKTSPWGFPDELKSWSWPNQEGKTIQVHIYSRSPLVKLELNGKIIGEQTIADSSITASFEVPYQPGTLIAKCYDNGKLTASDTLTTTGKPFAVRLIADRAVIKNSRNDLSYVSVEIVDDKGNVVPYLDDKLVKFNIAGNGEIAGVGNGNPVDLSSFQQPQKKVFQGRALVIIRPKGNAGKITLKAVSEGLKEASIVITVQ